MKTILKLLLVFSWLAVSTVSADFLGEADDAYVRFQVVTALDSKSGSLFTGRSQYGLLLIEQRNGIRNGIALTQDGDGNQLLNYLPPSTGFDIGVSRVEDYSVPIPGLDSSESANTSSPATRAAIGLTVLLVFGIILRHDLASNWQAD